VGSLDRDAIFGREDVDRADWCIHHLLSGGGYGQLA
jgi:hypothetical protein